jgi:hypothetical protein
MYVERFPPLQDETTSFYSEKFATYVVGEFRGARRPSSREPGMRELLSTSRHHAGDHAASSVEHAGAGRTTVASIGAVLRREACLWTAEEYRKGMDMPATDVGSFALAIMPIVLGALVAGISAVVKSTFDRRQARRSVERQLDLASKRTEFVKEWLDVIRTLDDAELSKAAAIRVKPDLELAYTDAQQALHRSRSNLEESWGDRVLSQLLWLLMLKPRRRAASYITVVVFYIVALFWWFLLLLPEDLVLTPEDLKDPDLVTSIGQELIAAILITIVLRVVAGLVVRALERRAKPVAEDLG